MSDDRDLEEIAKTAADDFYELLDVAFDASESEIKRAYRKASIKSHPDKNPDDPSAADRFIRLGIARDILINEKFKAEYDTQRQRKRERALQNDLLDSKRRKLKEDLERGEREAHREYKRKRGEMMEMTEREAEVQRLAEDGKRRRKEYVEKLQKARQEEEARFMQPTAEPVKPQAAGQTAEMDRTVKVKFQRDGETIAWDKDTISHMFGKYGKIDSVISLADKKVRLSGEKHRKVTSTFFVVFTRLDHGHAAVVDGKRDYPLLDSVAWVTKEPEIKLSTGGEFSAPSTPVATPNKAFNTSFNPSTPKFAFSPSTNSPSLQERTMIRLKQAAERKKQEAASSSSAGGSGKGAATPVAPKFSFSPSSNSPGLQERTMMRLKQAEKKKLEEEIRRREAEEEAAEEAAR